MRALAVTARRACCADGDVDSEQQNGSWPHQQTSQARHETEELEARGWRAYQTDEGKTYFHNEATSQTTWTHPLTGQDSYYDDGAAKLREENRQLKREVLRLKAALEQATLGKRPADSSEPILDELCELVIPTLTRDSSRRYLESMGASTFGSADELKHRLQRLFRVNKMGEAPANVCPSQPMARAGWYYPGQTNITTTRPE